MKNRQIRIQDGKQSRSVEVPADHRLVTRRDFLSHGLIAAASTFVMPSFLGLLTRQALGQGMGNCDAAAASSRVPFLVLDLAGGPNIAGKNVAVGALGGRVSGNFEDLELLSNGQYAALTVNEDRTRQANRDYGIALLRGNDSCWLSGMNEVTARILTNAADASRFRQRVDGVLVPVRTDDDTSGNALNPMYWIARSGARGELAALAGSQNTESGGRSIAPAASILSALRPVRVNSANQAAQLANLASLSAQNGAALNAAQSEKVLKAAGRMSEGQLAQFQSLEMRDQVKELISCGYLKASEYPAKYSDPNTFSYTADPSLNPIFQRTNEPTFNEHVSANDQLGVMMKLLLDGFVGGATITVGNLDYHGRGADDNNGRDRSVGLLIGKALLAARAKNKPLMIYVFTDGGVVSNNGQAFSADNGSRSATAMFFFDPKAARGDGIVSARQIGGYSRATGQVDTGSSLAANNLENLARLVVGNYLALHGEQGRLAQVTGSNPFADRMDSYIVAKKIV